VARWQQQQHLQLMPLLLLLLLTLAQAVAHPASWAHPRPCPTQAVTPETQ
jgi:hypothetical protein